MIRERNIPVARYQGVSQHPASGLLFTVLLGAAAFAAAPAAVQLPKQVPQGALVIGTAPIGSRVRLGPRELRLDADGRFVFGVGRDERGPLRIAVTQPAGPPRQFEIGVVARDWPTEHVDGVPQSTVTPTPEIAARIAREQAAVAASRVRDDARSDFAAPFSWPAHGRISGEFGSQRIYNGSPQAPHSGLDVAVPSATPLRAPAGGIVSFAAPDLFLTGGTVLIDHGHGVSSVFLHLSRIDVSLGQRVEAGQVFAAAGATGRASGPHMHWGLNWFELRLDPHLLVATP